MNTREAFLDRVRHAVAEGNRLSAVPPLPERGGIGYQSGGTDLVERFCAELTATGGTPHLAANADEACRQIKVLLQERAAKSVLLSSGGLVADVDLRTRLEQSGYRVIVANEVDVPNWREPYFAADVGISNVESLIAETGTVVMATKPNEPRSVSLLPPVHIALAHRRQILPDLFDLFDLFSPVADLSKPATLPPSCLTLITGPSKTGDIELKLVTGVHGPGEVHVIIVDNAPLAA